MSMLHLRPATRGTLLGLLGLAACSDASFKRINAAPLATITAPFDGQEVTTGDPVTLQGTVSDPDGAEETLRTWWFVGDREACGETTADPMGETSCTTEITAETIRLEVQDSDGAAGVDGITLSLVATDPPDTAPPDDTGDPPDTGDDPNQAPTCAITSPADGAALPALTAVTLAGTAADPDHPAEALTANWTSDVDGVLGEAAVDPDGNIALDVSFSTGTHSLSMTVTDPEGASCTDTIGLEQARPCPGLHVDTSGAQYASVPAHADFVADDTALTVAAWVRWDGHDGRDFYPIVSQGWGDDTTARFLLAVVGDAAASACGGSDAPGQLHFELLGSGGDGPCLASDRPLPIGRWTHVVGVYDTGEVRVFVNGVLDGTLSSGTTTLIPVDAAELRLGASPSGGGNGAGAVLAGVHIRAGTLPAVDFTPSWPPVAGTDTLGMWLLDDQDAVVADSSGRGHAASLVAGTWTPDCPDADADADSWQAWQDCDDGDAGIYPWAGDTLGDGVDGDCDGLDCEAAETGGTYWALCDEPGTWDATRDACQDADYDDLASFGSAAEEDPSWDLLLAVGNPTCAAAGYGCPWIGYRQGGGGAWSWADGTVTAYENWAGPEPNGDGDCAHMNRYGDRGWNDTPCTISDGTFGMVCERLMTP